MRPYLVPAPLTTELKPPVCAPISSTPTYHRIEAPCMRPYLVPAPALVNVAVSAHEEAVAYVAPSVAADVPVLDAPGKLQKVVFIR